MTCLYAQFSSTMTHQLCKCRTEGQGGGEGGGEREERGGGRGLQEKHIPKRLLAYNEENKVQEIILQEENEDYKEEKKNYMRKIQQTEDLNIDNDGNDNDFGVTKEDDFGR